MNTSPDQAQSGFNLGSFLAEQSHAGQTESSGEFTVANEKAMEKLAHFSLVGSYTWVLKLLQSIDLFRPEKVTVTQTRDKTTFHFVPTRDHPTEKTVEEAFRIGILRKNDPLAQLCLALRALVEQAGLSFVLSINTDEPSNSPIFSGDDISKMPEYQRLHWAHHTKPGVQLVVSHYKGKESLTGRLIPTFSKWERRDLKIASILEDNSLFHGTPIWLDGRYLNSPVTHADYGITTRYRTVLLWGVKLGEDGLQKLRVPPNFEGKKFSVYTTPARATRRYTGERDFNCWFLLRARAPGRLRSSGLYLSKARHEVLWLQDGVVVERSVARGLSLITEATVLISAEGFSTDLSGLALTRSPRRAEIQAQALDQVARALNEICQDTAFLEAPDEDEKSAEHEATPFRPGSYLDDIVPSVGFGVLGGLSLSGAAPFFVAAGVTAAGAALFTGAVRKYRTSEATQAALRKNWVSQVRLDLDRLTDLNQLKFKLQSSSGGGRKKEDLFKPKKPDTEERQDQP